MLPDYKGAVVVPNGNYFPNRSGLKPRYIIIHGTAGGTSAQAIAEYFKTTEGTSSPVTSTYVIGVQGEIYQCVAEKDGAWGNGYLSAGHDAFWDESINPNLITISIEHSKPSSDNSDELTPAQKAASFQLIKEICQRNGIPMRAADGNGGITGHYSIDPVNRRNCPGPYPWAELWQFLAQGDKKMDQVPAGWHDDGATLTAPNGKRVVHGFRMYVLANSWDAGNQPLEDECHVTQIEMHNVSLGGGQRQLFRDTMLYWTPSTDVQRSFVGMELSALYTLVPSLHSTIIQQQQEVQILRNKAPEPASLQPAIKVDDVAAALHDLISKSDAIKQAGDAIKVAGERALADIGKA